MVWLFPLRRVLIPIALGVAVSRWPLLDIHRGTKGREEKLGLGSSVCCRTGLETREVGKRRRPGAGALVAEVFAFQD